MKKIFTSYWKCDSSPANNKDEDKYSIVVNFLKSFSQSTEPTYKQS